MILISNLSKYNWKLNILSFPLLNMSDSLNEFAIFMDKYVVKDERVSYNFQSSLVPKGRYNVPAEDLSIFYENYEKCIATQKLGFREKISNTSVFVCEININVPYTMQKLDEKVYDKTFIKAIVKCIQDVLSKITTSETYDAHNVGYCLILETPKPRLTDEILNNNFKLYFPNAIFEKIDQEVHIIPRIRDKILKAEKKESYFHSYCLEKNIDIENLINKKIDVLNLMYGSVSNVDNHVYEITHTFINTFNRDKIILKELPYKKTEGITKILSTLKIFTEELQTHCNNNNAKILSHKEDLDLDHILNKIISYKKIKNSEYKIERDLNEAEQYLLIIDQKRANNHNDWLFIGKILYKTGFGCKEALSLWINFTKYSSNYNEKICVFEWNRMEINEIKKENLSFYAKIDNIDKVDELQQNEIYKLLEDSLNGGQYDMARILYLKYKDEYMCLDTKKVVFFQYENHKWNLDKEGNSLRENFSTNLLYYYEKFYKYTTDRSLEATVSEREQFNKKLQKITKVQIQLKTATFKNNLMKECCEVFKRKDIIFNTNPNLLHFTNGVLDLSQLRFRDGYPSDYLTLSTKYEYKNNYSWDHPDVCELQDAIFKLFVDNDLRAYFFQYCANILKGGNNQKIFMIMTGVGDNGKSFFLDLIEETLGDYVRVLPITSITGKRTQSSGATPELSNIEGVRFVYVQEPDGGDTINIGVLKEFTGNDRIYVRNLYSEGVNIKPMFKLAFICNKKPKVQTDDSATWNRVRVLPFESRFPKDESIIPTTFKEQVEKRIFPRDHTLNERLHRFRGAFIWMLFQTYISMERGNRCPEPKKVRDETSKYKLNEDVIYQFLEERIIKDEKSGGISLPEIYNLFRDYFRNAYAGVKVPDKQVMKEYLLHVWGPLDNRMKWKSYRERIEDQDKFILDPEYLDKDGDVGDEQPHSTMSVESEIVLTKDADDCDGSIRDILGGLDECKQEDFNPIPVEKKEKKKKIPLNEEIIV